MHLREFQGMMRQIYFHRDLERGTNGTYKWLAEELEELKTALQSKERKAVEDEFADVLAWLASLANVVGVDLENAALTKYDSKCPKCSKSPCQCSIVKKH